VSAQTEGEPPHTKKQRAHFAAIGMAAKRRSPVPEASASDGELTAAVAARRHAGALAAVGEALLPPAAKKSKMVRRSRLTDCRTNSLMPLVADRRVATAAQTPAPPMSLRRRRRRRRAPNRQLPPR
jgi:hypothetical protein